MDSLPECRDSPPNFSFKGGCAIDSRVTNNESLRPMAAGGSHEIIIKTATWTAGLAVDLTRDL